MIERTIKCLQVLLNDHAASFISLLNLMVFVLFLVSGRKYTTGDSCDVRRASGVSRYIG